MEFLGCDPRSPQLKPEGRICKWVGPDTVLVVRDPLGKRAAQGRRAGVGKTNVYGAVQTSASRSKADMPCPIYYRQLITRCEQYYYEPE